MTVPVEFEHIYPCHSTVSSRELMQEGKRDEALFRQKYPIDYTWQKVIERTQGRTGKRISAITRSLRKTTERTVGRP